MRREQRNGKSKTPIDAKQAALTQQEDKLREDVERLERLIEEAPKLVEKQEKRRREQLLEQSARRPSRHAPVLNDKRHEFQVSLAPTRRSRKSLKAEKKEARLKFFALAVVLILVLLWLWKIKP